MRWRDFVSGHLFTYGFSGKVQTKYTGSKMFCPKCRRSFSPPTILRLGGCLFGHGFQAWVVYQRVVLRLSYRLITATMEDMFCERTTEATVINFVRNLAGLLRPLREDKLRQDCSRVRSSTPMRPG